MSGAYQKYAPFVFGNVDNFVLYDSAHNIAAFISPFLSYKTET